MKLNIQYLQRAKEEGKNAIRFFNPHLQAMLETKIVLSEQLSHAIENHEIELFYQKQTGKHKQRQFLQYSKSTRYNPRIKYNIKYGLWDFY